MDIAKHIRDILTSTLLRLGIGP